MIQFRIYFILLINFLELTQLRASRLRIRQIEEILHEHNRHRRNLAMGLYGTRVSNMRKLNHMAGVTDSTEYAYFSMAPDPTSDVLETWSRSLQRHTSEILQCSSENSDLFQNSLTVNIGQGASLSGIIHEWFREIQHLFPYEASCLDSSPCSNILTMINAGHHSIGCSIKRCSGKIKLLCMYEGGAEYPPVYKPGAPCTKCSDEAAFCENGLCVACNPTTESCDCRKTCNKPLIGQGTLDNSTCTCTCSSGMGPNCDEECKNQNMYENWDICEEVTEAECNSPYPEEREMFEEFCPLKCGACNTFPYSQIFSALMRRSRGK